MAVKTSWSSGDVLTAADLTDTFAAKLDLADYTPGLSLVTTQSFSAVSSLSVNNCFSGDYDNYRILVSHIGSTSSTLLSRFRASGSDNSTSSYATGGYFATQATVGPETSGCGSGLNAMRLGVSGTSYAGHDITLFGPNIAQATTGHSLVGSTDATGRAFSIAFGGSAVFDGITIYPASGTITGTVSVYGYKK